MRKYILPILLIVTLVFGFNACKPESVPEKPDQEQPAPKPEPEPEPEPNPEPEPEPEPEPKPEPEPEPSETVIYYDNLDKVKSDVNNNYFNTWSDCRNMEGTGIATVTYDGSYTSVRSSFSSTGYPGASGVNGVYYSRDGARIEINSIGLPSDKRTYKLTVGMCAFKKDVVPNKTFTITVSDEHGKKSYNLNYTVKKYGQSWFLATSVFEVSATETTRLNIKITALADGAQGRTDDLRLVTTTDTASETFDFGHGAEPGKDYIERPATLKANADYKYVDHRGKTYRSQKDVRNYEACYDIRRHNPMWVAYPCHEIYWEGGYTRPRPDPWRPDPSFSESEQSIIYASDWNSWPWSATSGKPSDKYYYWSPLPSKNTVGKGHMMRSAERGCGNSSKLFDLNTQTFYPTNIAPERYLNETETDSHWSMVEYILPNEWRCSDTLYVVVGCYYGDDTWVLKDACNWGETSSKSKDCLMPTARYKLVMRTKSGSTGKPIWECSADEVMAIGFWFPQSFTGEKLNSLPPLADYIYPVADIERMIGGEFEFFPLAPEGVKNSCNISDWPGLSSIAGKPSGKG